MSDPTLTETVHDRAEHQTDEPRFGMFVGGAASFADAESREILNLLGDDAAGGSCCGGSCCTTE